MFRLQVDPFIRLLEPFSDEGPLLVVPDANVVVQHPDLARWSAALGVSTYTVILVPGVLAEIDQLKASSRKSDAFREKARSFSNLQSRQGVAEPGLPGKGRSGRGLCLRKRRGT